MTTDIRARFAAGIANAAKAEAEPVASKGEVRKGGVSKARQELLHTMLFERYEAPEAQRRYDAFDWSQMSVAEFQRFFAFLKATPKLNAPAAPVPVVKNSTVLIEGRFTVVFEDDTYKTIRVRRQASDASFKPGALLLGYLSGQDNTNDYTSFGHVDDRTGKVVIWKKHRDNEPLVEAVKVLTSDPKAAAQAYFEQSGNCVACGRVITRPDSLENAKTNGGLGPDCEDKAGW